jgi:hypothetical protein
MPHIYSVKYLGIHLDRKLTWRSHISVKRKQLDLKLRSIYWIIGRKSQLSLADKLLVYEAILKPIWTYDIQLWGNVSNYNIHILENVPVKSPTNSNRRPWYVPNAVIKHDLLVTSVR